MQSLYALRWPLGRATHSQELLLERLGDQHEICPATADRTFPHLNHQAKKATPSFYRVIGILLPVLLALRQHHSAVEKPRRLCVALWPLGPIWATMGLLSGGALEAALHNESTRGVSLLGESLGSS